MTYRYMKQDKALPLWAALGAPLVGVPLMVGLLALATPKQEAPVEEPVPVLVNEAADTHVVPALRDSAPELSEELDAG